MANTALHITSYSGTRAKWLLAFVIMLFSVTAFSQDKKAVNNKRQINEMKAKSVKKKEKATTKDIAGKRLRTKNKSSTADRAIYSNPSPYADKKRSGGDRSPKGSSPRIRSRSAETARENVYPSSGAFTNGSRSGSAETGKPQRVTNTRRGKLSSSKSVSFRGGRTSGPRSGSRSAETSRSNVYPQKGPFVNRSSRGSEQRAARVKTTRSGKLSTNSARIRNTYSSAPRSRSTSAETRGGRSTQSRYGRTGKMSTSASFRGRSTARTQSRSSSAENSKSKRYGQTGAYVNRSSRTTERAYTGKSGTTRTGKLSAGPVPPGKKKRVAPRSASQPFVTKGRKDVYWGKFSKGEKPFTTDISGSPLRRRNYSTPPNEIVQQRNPYEGRKKSKGDRAYSGTFKSGHVSATRQTQRAWKGDISGAPIRKRSSAKGEVAGKRIPSGNTIGGSGIQKLFSGGRKGIKPEKGGGSISASGKYRSNQRISGRTPGVGASAMMRNQGMKGVKPVKGGGSISATGKYRSNQKLVGTVPGEGVLSMMGSQRMKGSRPQKGGGGSISATGKYRSNQALQGRTPGIGASAMLKGQGMSGIKPKKGGGGSISASGKYRSNEPFRGRSGPMSVSGQARDNRFRPHGGGSISASSKYRSNQPLRATAGSISATGKYRSNEPYRGRFGPMSVSGKIRDNKFRPQGGGSISASAKYRSNKPIHATAGSISETGDYRSNKPFKGRMGKLSVSGENRTYPFKPNGGGSISGKVWNNNGKPIDVKLPTGAEAASVGYSGFIKQSLFKRAYEQNPNAHKEALKKQKPMNTVYMADGLQISVRAKETGKNPNAFKGSLPGVKPSKSTVKASEYDRSIKRYWSYKHNPSSAELAQKTLAPSKSFERASAYSGRTRLTKNYRHNPNSDENALKVLAPGRAYARITDYQGNIKMSKYNSRKHMPDAQFAHHSNKNNVKNERTIGTDVKLFWSKIFKKNDIQPSAVKEKSRRPRYDKGERELWKDLYD